MSNISSNYRVSLLAIGLMAVSAEAAAVSVTTAGTNGADAGFRASSPDVNEGNGTGPISFDNSSNPGTQAATNIGAIVLRFGVGDLGTKSNAVLNFYYRRNNSNSFALYGLNDNAAGQDWSETGITANGAVANGWFTIDSSTPAFPTLVAGSGLTLIGSLAQSGASANTLRAFPNGGTETAPNTAFDNFLSADTDGLVTLLLVPSSTRSPFFYNREAIGTTLTAPTLSFVNTPPETSTPEPAVLGLAGVGAVFLGRRRK